MGLHRQAAPLTWAVRALVVVAAMLGLGLATSTAHASDGCGGTLEQPFLAWQDDGNYWLAPGGSFEDGAAGWDLAGGAQVVSPDLPSPGPSGQAALSIPAGGSATSAPFCVDPTARFARMFAVTSSDGSRGRDRLGVEVLPLDGSHDAGWAGTLRGESAWSPTRPFRTAAPAGGWDGSGQAWMQYRFTALGDVAWTVDDLYIDPHANH
jgi:hypothetical protein